MYFTGKDNGGGAWGVLASTSTGIVTDTSWKCTTKLEDDWTRCFFDDAHWPHAKIVDGPDNWPWNYDVSSISRSTSWIWTDRGSNSGTVYCRKRIKGSIRTLMLFYTLELNSHMTSHYLKVTDDSAFL